MVFGMTKEDVLRVLGPPSSVGSNADGESEHCWPHITVRYGTDSGEVVEIAIPTEQSISIGGAPLLPSVDPVSTLLELDRDPVLCLGFLLFLKLGVAITGLHDDDREQSGLTVFPEGRWDDLAAHFEPYPS